MKGINLLGSESNAVGVVTAVKPRYKGGFIAPPEAEVIVRHAVWHADQKIYYLDVDVDMSRLQYWLASLDCSPKLGGIISIIADNSDRPEPGRWTRVVIMAYMSREEANIRMEALGLTIVREVQGINMEGNPYCNTVLKDTFGNLSHIDEWEVSC